MMNSEEFTKFINELRKEYGLPQEFPKSVSRPSGRSPMVVPEEPEPAEFHFLNEEDCTTLQQPEDTLT